VFVSLGLGSVVATSLEAAPWLIPIGRHKGTVFAAVGVLLAVNYWLAIVRPRQMDCPPGEICHIDSPAMRVSRIVFWMSVGIWAGAVALAYAAPWWVRLQS
jgi:mercuric ion transport protein